MSADQTFATPDAPEAPVHYDNASASSWQSGWATGYEAAVYSLRGACVPQVDFDSYFRESSGFGLWPNHDRTIAQQAAFATWQFLTQGAQATPIWRDDMHQVKAWIERAKESDDWPIFSGDGCVKYMDAEFHDLRVYIQGMHAGADYLNKVVTDLRAENDKLKRAPVADFIGKPVAYRYSVSGMYEYATQREVAVAERKVYEDYAADDPDVEHEEPEPLYTYEQVQAIVAAALRAQTETN